MEAYDLDQTVASKLGNITTRGFVDAGDNVMIAARSCRKQWASVAFFERIGPTLADLGVPDALSDPTLELRDGSGTVIAFNDDWQTPNRGRRL